MCYGTKKELKPVLQNTINKLVSICNISTIKDGYVNIDYRMFEDLTNIAMCGAERIKDNEGYEMLEKSGENLGHDEEQKFILNEKDWRRIREMHRKKRLLNKVDK